MIQNTDNHQCVGRIITDILAYSGVCSIIPDEPRVLKTYTLLVPRSRRHDRGEFIQLGNANVA